MCQFFRERGIQLQLSTRLKSEDRDIQTPTLIGPFNSWEQQTHRMGPLQSMTYPVSAGGGPLLESVHLCTRESGIETHASSGKNDCPCARTEESHKTFDRRCAERIVCVCGCA